MPTKTENQSTGVFIKSEGNGKISRDEITIASGQGVLVAGTVLGKVTATGKYIAYDDNNSDGSQTAAAILYATVDATSADAKAVGIVRYAEIWRDRLLWASTVAAGEKTTAYADLAALGIVLRT